MSGSDRKKSNSRSKKGETRSKPQDSLPGKPRSGARSKPQGSLPGKPQGSLPGKSQGKLASASEKGSGKFQHYYQAQDYQRAKPLLDQKIKEIHQIFIETLEPTLDERTRVRQVILEFIRERKLIMYGGTAMNKAIEAKKPSDAFYDRYNFGDFEVYSQVAHLDTYDLADRLLQAGFTDVYGKSAVHEGTFKIFVNGGDYCDLTYVPPVIYRQIPTFQIDQVKYVHPHFALIDQLRIINQPITAGEFRWCKTWDRMFRVLRSYPLPASAITDRTTLAIEPSSLPIKEALIDSVLDFIATPEMRDNLILGGVHAYNMYLHSAAAILEKPEMQQLVDASTFLPEMVELFAVRYEFSVTELFAFLRSRVQHPKKLSVAEFFPFFQFVEHSLIIYYDTYPIVRVMSKNDHCLPTTPSTQGIRYITYQYLLCTLMIEEFRSRVHKDAKRATQTKFAIRRLVAVRNHYYAITKESLINDGPFGEFIVNCIGETSDFRRAHGQKKRDFRKPMVNKYSPEQAIQYDSEKRNQLRTANPRFPFINGAEIEKGKMRVFKWDDQGNLVPRAFATDLEEELSDPLDDLSDSS